MSKALFVTGTGTDVGKTYVTALLVKALHAAGKNAAYYKAAMSGNEADAAGALIPGDALFVQKTAGLSQPLHTMCPYVYKAAVSPHLASRWEGSPVEMPVVQAGFQRVCAAHDYVTVEGSGGILCPLRWDDEKLWLEDVIRTLHLGSILVASACLGTINSTVLTAHYMQSKNLPLKGLIFNDYHPGNAMEEDNIAMCAELTGLPVLAKVQRGDTSISLSPDALANLYDEVENQ